MINEQNAGSCTPQKSQPLPNSIKAGSLWSVFAEVAETVGDNGYSLLPVKPASKMPAIMGYQEYCLDAPSSETVRQWVEEFPAHGLGLCMGYKGLMCLDIDVLDVCLVHGIRQLAFEHLGPTPLERIGKSPKLGLFYRLDGEDRSGIGSVGMVGDQKQQVEIWLDRRFMVSYGEHPDTGNPYQWVGDGAPDTVHIDDLPHVTRDQLLEFRTALLEKFGDHRLDNGSSGSSTQNITRNSATGLVTDGREALLSGITYRVLREAYVECRDLSVLRAESSKIAAEVFDVFCSEVATLANFNGTDRECEIYDAIKKVKQKLSRAADAPEKFFLIPTEQAVTLYRPTSQPEGTVYNPHPVHRGREFTDRVCAEFVEAALQNNIQRRLFNEYLEGLNSPISHQPFVMPPLYMRRALAVTTGVGKSTIMRKHIGEYIRRARSLHPFTDAPYTKLDRALVFVPTLALAEQWATELRADYGEEFNVAVAYGRHAPDPRASDELVRLGRSGDRVCDDTMKKAAQLLQTKGVKAERIDQMLCQGCSFVDSCVFHTQRDVTVNADILIVAHAYLNLASPDHFGEDFGIAIIDEGCSGQAHVDKNDRTLDVSDLGTQFERYFVRTKREDGQYYRSSRLTEKCREYEVVLGEWLERQPIETALSLNEVPLEIKELEAFRKHEFNRLVQSDVELESVGNLASLDAAYPSSQFIAKRTHLITAIIMAKKADSRLAHYKGYFGARVVMDGERKLVRVNMSKRVNSKVGKIPMLVLDATYDSVQMGEYLYPIVQVADFHVEAEHRTVTLIEGRDYGMRAIGNDDTAAVIVKRVAEEYDEGKILFVCNKRNKEEFLKLLRDSGLGHAVVLHHGALSGIDDYGDVSLLVIAGHPRASWVAVADMCRDIGHEPTTLEKQWVTLYDPAPNGMCRNRSVQQYKDETMQKVGASIEFSSVVQAEGRSRAVNRTSDNPVRTLVFGDLPLAFPFVVDVFETAKTEKPIDRLFKMFVTGVVPTGKRQMASLYPEVLGGGGMNADICRAQRVLDDLQNQAAKVGNENVCAFLGVMTGKHWVQIEHRSAGSRGRTPSYWVQAETTEDAVHVVELAWCRRLEEPLGVV